VQLEECDDEQGDPEEAPEEARFREALHE
jgi:hypothetical protein